MRSRSGPEPLGNAFYAFSVSSRGPLELDRCVHGGHLRFVGCVHRADGTFGVHSNRYQSVFRSSNESCAQLLSAITARPALSMHGCTKSIARHPKCAEPLIMRRKPGSEIAQRRATRIALRFNAKVAAETLAAAPRKNQKEPERRSLARAATRRLSGFVDVAFVPSGLRNEPDSDVGAAASLLETVFVPAALRRGTTSPQLGPDHSGYDSAASYPALKLDLGRQKLRERKRRDSEGHSDYFAPCGAEDTPDDAPSIVLASCRPLTPTLQPPPLTSASRSDTTDSDNYRFECRGSGP